MAEPHFTDQGAITEKREGKRNLLQKHHGFGQVMMLWPFIRPQRRAAHVNGVKEIMREEGERIGFQIKVVEKSGTSLASPAPTCPAASTLTAGWRTRGHHTPERAKITGELAPCAKSDTEEKLGLTPMRGWTHMRGRSGAMWRPTPWPGIWRRSTRPGGGTPQLTPSLWPLTRQMREAQKIANETPGMLINGRNEHIPPAIRPLATGHLLDREALRAEQARAPGQ